MTVPPTQHLMTLPKQTARDESLRALKNIHLSNGANWDDLKLKPFMNQIKGKITIDLDHQVLLQGSRIMIPMS